MTVLESVTHNWEDDLQKSNLPLTATTIESTKLAATLNAKDPFSKDNNNHWISVSDLNKDGKISKQEYFDMSQYIHQRMGSNGQRNTCVPRYDKHIAATAATRPELWTKCASSADEPSCKNDQTCEWDFMFNPEAEWKMLAQKAGVSLQPGTDHRIP